LRGWVTAADALAAMTLFPSLRLIKLIPRTVIITDKALLEGNFKRLNTHIAGDILNVEGK
jgi:hypothetical protein